MKSRIKNSLSILVIVALFYACGSSGGTDTPSANQVAAGNLTPSAWKYSDAKFNAGAPDGDFSNLTLTFTGSEDGGSFTTSGVPAGFEVVMPASGTWAFNGDTGSSVIIKSSGNADITVAVDVSETALSLTYTVVDPNGGLYGTWVFKFTH